MLKCLSRGGGGGLLSPPVIGWAYFLVVVKGTTFPHRVSGTDCRFNRIHEMFHFYSYCRGF